ncbi:hypothetical protein BZA05DRAFT_420689 [Tricharina praecox]|uniref:uncharacterized protein n=1 Tax=Tricharina praecox TaxID=43433 RepID=UPI00221F566E|nr:uncharacterized protein BZA05DRAFT_420689 [Tricharina praecox]KAI5846846.1 hypothetical protein BZA05DRAFT_420689 [Tricharina praecox]
MAPRTGSATRPRSSRIAEKATANKTAEKKKPAPEKVAAKPKGISKRAPKKRAPKSPPPPPLAAAYASDPGFTGHTYHPPVDDSVIEALKESLEVCPEPSGRVRRYPFRNEVFRRGEMPRGIRMHIEVPDTLDFEALRCRTPR